MTQQASLPEQTIRRRTRATVRGAVRRPVLSVRRARRAISGLAPVLGFRAALSLVARTRFRRRSPVSFTWPGLDHAVWVRPGTSDLRSFLEVFVDRVYDWPAGFHPTSPQFGTIVDAGANVGFSVLWFARQHPGATIVALEADPDNVELLRRNTSHLPGVACRHQALWNEVTTLDLRRGTSADSGQVAAGTPPPASDGAHDDAARIDAIDLASLLDELGLDRLDLLKIDIEGAEYEVFAGSGPWIDRVDVIAGELHERYRPGVGAVLDQALIGFPNRVDRRFEFFVSR